MSPTTVERPLARVIDPLLPRERPQRRALRRDLIRLLVLANLVLGVNYLLWRWLASINWDVWWIALPLVLAETYSFADACLFGLTMWRIKERGAAPPPDPATTVDVFITTYNEEPELLRGTTIAARDMTFPHETWLLDDGARDEVRALADELGVGYITRSADWKDRPRHAKAGNLNNALLQTSGELLCILDADQVPDPDMLDKVVGWFRDPQVALVQTPQWFHNVPDSDPMGSQAPLFYGPIQQGKDGWNAAFFCGSNAVLRREALMQLGITGYVRDVEEVTRRVLRTAGGVLRKARGEARRRGDDDALGALEALEGALREVRRDLDAGLTTQEATHRFRREVDAISRRLVEDDLAELRADLEALGDTGFMEADEELGGVVLDEDALRALSGRDLSPLGAIASVQRLVDDLDATLDDEAQPVMPLATISVTEDMATAMRLHALGWRSVYHHEVLVEGLAPEDLRSMLTQRLRWAQGTLQVLLRENPLVKRGLSAGQKLMYLATMWTYLSGFAALVYLAAPVLYLCFGILPVTTLGEDFLWHLVPYLLVNQALFIVVGYGMRTWRGQQYSLALFPLWITACWTAAANVWFGRGLGFVVTPKSRQAGASLRLVRVQLAAMAILVLSAVVGLVRLMLGVTDEGGAVMLNVLWVVYDLVALSAVVDAALYRGPDVEEA